MNVVNLDDHLHTEWLRARPALQDHIDRHPEIVHQAVREELRRSLPLLLLWLSILNIVGIVATVFVVTKLQSDHLARLNRSSVAVIEEGRIQAIIAVLPQIPHGPANRHMDGDLRGRPTVTAIQARVDIPEVSARERDIACGRVEGVCQPQAKRSP